MLLLLFSVKRKSLYCCSAPDTNVSLSFWKGHNQFEQVPVNINVQPSLLEFHKAFCYSKAQAGAVRISGFVASCETLCYFR